MGVRGEIIKLSNSDFVSQLYIILYVILCHCDVTGSFGTCTLALCVLLDARSSPSQVTQ